MVWRGFRCVERPRAFVRSSPCQRGDATPQHSGWVARSEQTARALDTDPIPSEPDEPPSTQLSNRVYPRRDADALLRRHRVAAAAAPLTARAVSRLGKPDRVGLHREVVLGRFLTEIGI